MILHRSGSTTVEFGLGWLEIGKPWGHAPGPVPNEAEALDFLEFAYRLGVRYFECAASYAVAERRLGAFLHRKFHFGLPGSGQYTPSRHPLILRVASYSGSRLRPRLPRRHRQGGDPSYHRPEEPPGRMALGQQQPVMPGVLDQSAARLHHSLWQARQRPLADPVWQHRAPLVSGYRFGSGQ